ncbi:MAG: pilus assembly protein N-terminal domain-containing protein [Myxococcota bacterium]|jgi:pilus assembly protein CpaC|nr:pilus assembly protein N-terminal domain-containing protein [Myxococcota bacterium]
MGTQHTRFKSLWLLLLTALLLAPGRTLATPLPQTDWMNVEKGASLVFDTRMPISRILVSDDTIVQINMLDQEQFQVRGVELGTTDLWIWYRSKPSNPIRYDVSVHRDVSDLARRIETLTEYGQGPSVHAYGERIVIQGPTPDLQTLESIAALAAIYDPDFVNLMSVSGDHQVQLEVLFAEVNRSAMRELGLSALWSDGGLLRGDASVNLSPPVSISEAFAITTNISDAFDLDAMLSILEENNLSRTLARPTLVALSGQQAEFLAGGELPFPVAQFDNRVTVDFREFGVKLSFVPTVLGEDVIDMRVYVEVSDLDEASSVTITDIAIPGFVSRKSQSHLRLESGMTFAMAGMLSEQTTTNVAKIPILGDIPLVGALFRYVRHRRDETELVIYVTPRLVRPLAANEVPAPPGSTSEHDPNDFDLFILGLDHRSGLWTQPGTQLATRPTGPVGIIR